MLQEEIKELNQQNNKLTTKLKELNKNYILISKENIAIKNQLNYKNEENEKMLDK